MRDRDVGLALSGGGFRATLLHLGALWRLNELGFLPRLARVSSVSGGSIMAGVLGHRWQELSFDADGVAIDFDEAVADPIQRFCCRVVDRPAIVEGLVLGWVPGIGPPARRLAAAYRKHLFGSATLQDLPERGEGPLFIFCATSLQTGKVVRMSQPYAADYTVGVYDEPVFPLANVVTASSAFPPAFSPAWMRPTGGTWRTGIRARYEEWPQLRRDFVLADGGAYDNLGLEPLRSKHRNTEPEHDFGTKASSYKDAIVLASDAGAPFDMLPRGGFAGISMVASLARSLMITTDQARSLRKRRLVDAYKRGETKGVYWGIQTKMASYQNDYREKHGRDLDTMVDDNNVTRALRDVKTRLASFSPETRGQLVNWGYALADAGMRTHVLPSDPGRGSWPVPEYALDAESVPA